MIFMYLAIFLPGIGAILFSIWAKKRGKEMNSFWVADNIGTLLIIVSVIFFYAIFISFILPEDVITEEYIHTESITPINNGTYFQDDGDSVIYAVETPSGNDIKSVDYKGKITVVNDSNTPYVVVREKRVKDYAEWICIPSITVESDELAENGTMIEFMEFHVPETISKE